MMAIASSASITSLMSMPHRHSGAMEKRISSCTLPATRTPPPRYALAKSIWRAPGGASSMVALADCITKSQSGVTSLASFAVSNGRSSSPDSRRLMKTTCDRLKKFTIDASTTETPDCPFASMTERSAANTSLIVAGCVGAGAGWGSIVAAAPSTSLFVVAGWLGAGVSVGAAADDEEDEEDEDEAEEAEAEAGDAAGRDAVEGGALRWLA
jgi:hypothetical protein